MPDLIKLLSSLPSFHLRWRHVHHLVELCEECFPWSASSSFAINKPCYYKAFQIIFPRNSAAYERSLSIMMCVCSSGGITLHWLASLSMRVLAFFGRTRSPASRAFSSCPHLLSTFHIHSLYVTFQITHSHCYVNTSRY